MHGQHLYVVVSYIRFALLYWLHISCCLHKVNTAWLFDGLQWPSLYNQICPTQSLIRPAYMCDRLSQYLTNTHINIYAVFVFVRLALLPILMNISCKPSRLSKMRSNIRCSAFPWCDCALLPSLHHQSTIMLHHRSLVINLRPALIKYTSMATNDLFDTTYMGLYFFNHLCAT